VSLRVVAVVAGDQLGVPVVLPRDLVRAHDPSALTGAVFTDASRDAVGAAIGGLGGQAKTVRDWATADDGEVALLEMFALLLIVTSAGYSAVAVANTLLMATRDRAGEFAVLRLAGASPGQVLRLVVAESAVLAGAGAVLGGAIAGVALLAIRSGLAEQIGAPVAISVPWAGAGIVVSVCLALAVAASAGPAAALLRRPA
jgi:putative ABC transport system permease protein